MARLREPRDAHRPGASGEEHPLSVRPVDVSVGAPPATRESQALLFGAGGPLAVDHVSLELPKGALLALLGPSGCGKTTTLRMIGGFEQPTSGLIELKGADVTFLPAHERDVNTVFQSYALFPHLTIYENVAFGLRRSGVHSARSARS